MINLRKTLNEAHSALEQAGVAHALIGGFALATYGHHRATADIDLLADGTKKEQMLKQAQLNQELNIYILKPEDIIGLKIQAYKNDTSRELQDKADIQKLLALPLIDLVEVKKYADLFGEWVVIEKLQGVKQ